MSNPNKDKPRPVDALFGDSGSAALPNYIVEPAQPVTTVTPPTPDETTPDLPTLTEPPPASATPAARPLEPVEPVAAEPVSPPPAMVELAAPPPAPVRPPAPLLTAEPSIFSPEPILMSRTSTEDRFAQLSDRIDRLYSDVKLDLRDSKAATDFCFELLLQARQAVEDRNFARAEFFTQSVDAKLKRSERSMKAARGIGVWLLWLWELCAFALGGALIALTYIPSLTLFGLPVALEFIVLLRAMGWGMIGGVIGALYNLPWFVQFREYDPAYNMNYFARPIVGLLVGAMLFLVSQAGILAGNITLPGNVQLGPVFLYVVAALSGFKQEYVTEFFDSLLKIIFRVPQVPKGLKPPQAPTK